MHSATPRVVSVSVPREATLLTAPAHAPAAACSYAPSAMSHSSAPPPDQTLTFGAGAANPKVLSFWQELQGQPRTFPLPRLPPGSQLLEGRAQPIGQRQAWNKPIHIQDPTFTAAQKARYKSEKDVRGSGLTREAMLALPRNRMGHVVSARHMKAVQAVEVKDMKRAANEERGRALMHVAMREETRALLARRMFNSRAAAAGISEPGTWSWEANGRNLEASVPPPSQPPSPGMSELLPQFEPSTAAWFVSSPEQLASFEVPLGAYR